MLIKEMSQKCNIDFMQFKRDAGKCDSIVGLLFKKILRVQQIFTNGTFVSFHSSSLVIVAVAEAEIFFFYSGESRRKADLSAMGARYGRAGEWGKKGGREAEGSSE